MSSAVGYEPCRANACHGRLPLSAEPIHPPAFRGGGESSFSMAIICNTRRRIPAGASGNQGPEKGGLIPL